MKKHNHMYFHIKDRVWLPIPGAVCLVNLPIALQIPELKTEPLIAHRDIKNPKIWAVTHAETSGTIARGKTRAEAIKNAEQILLMVGSKAFLKSIASCRNKITPRPEVTT